MLPPAVVRMGRGLARATGVDEPSCLSFAAEAWWASDGNMAMAYTVARRDCIDARRHSHGRRTIRPEDVPLDVVAGMDPDHIRGMAVDEPGFARAEARCDLAALVGDLPDNELAALARHWWLGLPVVHNSPAAVVLARAVRHARRSAAHGNPSAG